MVVKVATNCARKFLYIILQFQYFVCILHESSSSQTPLDFSSTIQKNINLCFFAKHFYCWVPEQLYILKYLLLIQNHSYKNLSSRRCLFYSVKAKLSLNILFLYHSRLVNFFNVSPSMGYNYASVIHLQELSFIAIEFFFFWWRTCMYGCMVLQLLEEIWDPFLLFIRRTDASPRFIVSI